MARRRARRARTSSNPASGVIVNWNNKPAVGWPAGDQREFWGPIDRVLGLRDRLTAELAAGRPFTVDSVNAVMAGAATSDVFASRIVPYLRAAVAGCRPARRRSRPPRRRRSSLIDAWLADGAPLVAVGDTLPHPGRGALPRVPQPSAAPGVRRRARRRAPRDVLSARQRGQPGGRPRLLRRRPTRSSIARCRDPRRPCRSRATTSTTSTTGAATSRDEVLVASLRQRSPRWRRASALPT